MKNFYPDQYKKDKGFKINHNYLTEQFSDVDIILQKIRYVVTNNDFTLGECVDDVEKLIAELAGTEYAIGVGSGTDAIFLSLKALGVGEGDEVITTTYTFYATIGAIVTSGATPVFCDCGEDYNIDADKIESLITSRTKAIVPVHWSGRPCEMNKINEIAKRNNLYVVEDACHALKASYQERKCGSLGDTGCFSFHPLKNLNVWGDGGIITTDNEELADKLKLMRNHGLVNRDECKMFAYNSRLDTLQAVVAKHLIENKIDNITGKRQENAHTLDRLLSNNDNITLPDRRNELEEVFHLYMFQAKRRDELIDYLKDKGIDAKIHYPVNMHLQPAAKYLGYSKGDFPVAEKLSNGCVSLPVHEYVDAEDIKLMADSVKSFYSN